MQPTARLFTPAQTGLEETSTVMPLLELEVLLVVALAATVSMDTVISLSMY